MANERTFIVKMPDGAEQGPFDQRTLINMAQNGQLTADCEVRSAMLKRYSKAEHLPFLKDIMAAQKKSEDERQSGTLQKIKDRATAKVEVKKPVCITLKSSEFVYTPASILLRMAAGSTDLLIALALTAAAVMVGRMLKNNGLGADIAFYAGAVLFYLVLVLYFTWTVGFRAQTLGQQYWGLLVLKKQGGPVFLGRALVFSISVIFLGFLTPLVCYVLPSRRAFPDILSGTRVVRTRIVSLH